MGFKESKDHVLLDGSLAYIKEACERSLKNLGVDEIDLYYLHRVDPKTPIEISIEALAALVKEGKIKQDFRSQARDNSEGCKDSSYLCGSDRVFIVAT